MFMVCYTAHTGLASSNADVEQYWDVSVSASRIILQWWSDTGWKRVKLHL